MPFWLVCMEYRSFNTLRFIIYKHQHHHQVPTVTQISPSTGRVNGGVNVTITGSGFVSASGGSDQPMCVFGSLVSPAIVVSESVLTCIAPPHPRGIYACIHIYIYIYVHIYIAGYVYIFIYHTA
jgi:hypothetical protein